MNLQKKSRQIAQMFFLLATLIGFSAYASAPSTIEFVNGGFEGYTGDTNEHNSDVPPGWTSIGGTPDTFDGNTNFAGYTWEASSTFGDFLHCIGEQPSWTESAQQLALDGLVIGQEYEISFEQSISRSQYTETGGFWRIFFGDESHDSDHMQLPNSDVFEGWEWQTMIFTATAESQNLTVTAISDTDDLRTDLGIDSFYLGAPGQNPDNPTTGRPTADDPADKATIAEGSIVELDTSDYIDDPDGATHAETHWEVWRADTGMLLNGYPLVVTPPDSSMTLHEITETLWAGLKYIWRVTYLDSDGNQSTSRKYSFKIGESEAEFLPYVKKGTDVGDFGMISIAHWPDNPSAEAVFNIEYAPHNYRIGTYDAIYNRYIEFGGGLEMEPGKSYWILAREGLVVYFNGIPVSLNHDIEVGLRVNEAAANGWNMIAPPNDANYLWGDVQVGRFVEGSPGLTVAPMSLSDTDPNVDTLIDRHIWQWEDGAYVAYHTTDNFELQSYSGYWVNGKLDGVYLVFPQSAQVAGLSTPGNTLLALKGKALKWLKKWKPETRAAIADNDSPPMPMGAFDENSVDNIFEGCFIETLRYY